MRTWLWLALCLMGFPALADDNIVTNHDFTTGIQHWLSNSGDPVKWDANRGHRSPGSIVVPAGAGRTSARLDVQFDGAPNMVSFSGWALCERLADVVNTNTGLDIGVTLDNGVVQWFIPPSARVQAGSAGWQALSGRYFAPEGRTIKKITLFCLNYRNDVPVWFDDLALSVNTVTVHPAEITLLSAVSPDGRTRERRLYDLASHLDLNVAISPHVPSIDDCRLLIVPEWEDGDRMLEAVKTFAYRGGRVFFASLPADASARAFRDWALGNHEPLDLAVSDDGMIAAAGPDAKLTDERILAVLRELLAATYTLPPVPDTPYQWEDAPSLSFDRRAVYIDGRPILLFAAGAYTLGRSECVPSVDFPKFADLGMNSLVVYVPADAPLKDLVSLLDEAQANDLYCLIYLRYGSGTHHPGRPWRPEWIAKFSPVAAHPAFIGWLTGDDVFARHQSMMARTREIIRHYASRGLICMTLMDPRRPQNFSAEHWRKWDAAFDFPVTYTYTLQRGDGFPIISAMEGGMFDLTRLGDNAIKAFPEMPHLQWVQAHMQMNRWKDLGLDVSERWLPTPEQQAILDLHALAGGSDGLLYFTHDTITEQAGGLGRRWQLKIIHHQIRPISELLLMGDRQHLDVTGEAAATLFTDGTRSVILVRRIHDYDAGQVRFGDPVTVDIRLPAQLRRAQFVRLTPLGTQNAGTAVGTGLRVRNFSGWEILATSTNPADIEAWNYTLQKDRAGIREAIWLSLFDTWAKTRATLQVLASANLALPLDSRFTLQEGTALGDDEFLVLMREQRVELLSIQETEMAVAQHYWAAKSDLELPQAARTFYGLPHFYKQAGENIDYAPGMMRKIIRADYATLNTR